MDIINIMEISVEKMWRRMTRRRRRVRRKLREYVTMKGRKGYIFLHSFQNLFLELLLDFLATIVGRRVAVETQEGAEIEFWSFH